LEENNGIEEEGEEEEANVTLSCPEDGNESNKEYPRNSNEQNVERIF
jgi:hypothetical protein